MSIDGSQIGRVTMDALGEIEKDYGSDAELVRCMLLVEVRYPDEDEPEKKHTHVMWADDEASPSGRVGLVLLALRGLLS